MGFNIKLKPAINNINYNKRAEGAIAHGALTNSKRPSSFVRNVYPTHFKSAYGCTMVDVDGRLFTDFICGLGTNLFGYANPAIARSVTYAMQTGGSVFSMGSDVEVEYAEMVRETFPFLDRVRFLKTGSEGCAAAVRIARAYTGRALVLSEGYHGWHDEFTTLTDPATGVALSDFIDRLDNYRDDYHDYTAAVIIEPIITDIGPERIKWLQKLRDDCTKKGIVLIFDETITAFRFPSYSVAKHLNILPDLWVGGKALGGGLPLSVVGGKKEIMECDYFVSSTFAGDRLALAAGITALDLIHGEYKPDDLWVYGTEFIERFNDITEHVKIVGYPTRGVFKYLIPQYEHLFMQAMCEAGILIGPSWFYNKFLHSEIDNVISLTKSIVKKIARGDVNPRGYRPVPPLSERSRNAEGNESPGYTP